MLYVFQKTYRNYILNATPDEPTGNLDSANGEAVMELLHELHRSATVCLVTHSPHYARYADYVVHLFDERISQQEERS
jgi:putative ABC transport system ATP-binding protein